ncbi:MAG: aspartate aminotransferase family protein [Deltaproteobacteria bacterium]|nr:aspartate aminotransferase family protein [Deltaproteobacteria bacterium]
MLKASKTESPATSGFSIKPYLENQGSRFENHLNFMNPQLPKVLKTLGFDKTYVRGEGAHLWDAEGNRYLDFLSGYGVFNFGRYHPVMVETMKEMLEIKDANLVQFDCPHLLGELAKALIQKVPYCDRVYFCSTGAESVETAIKFAKAHTQRDRILYLDHAFHGLTMGALSVNGNAEFRNGFGKFSSDGDKIPFDNISALENELKKKDVAAFIFEPVQGKGVYIHRPGFLKEAEVLCRKYGTLTVADEIQSGMGRTGKFLASEYENIEPDMVLISKSLSGGLVPTAAVIAKDKIFKSVYSKMDRCVVHSSSFGKNSLSAAMGLASLWVLDNENMLEKANWVGEQIRSKIMALKPKYEMLGEVRARGCMIGIEFQAPKSMQLKMGWSLLHTLSKDLFPQLIIVPLMKDFRILTQTSGHHQDIVKLLPPLVTSQEDIDYFVSSFEKVLQSAHKFPGGVWDLGKTLAKAAMSDNS